MRPLFLLSSVLFAASAFGQFSNAGQIKHQVVQMGQYSSVRDQQMITITNQDQFEKYWERTMRQPARTAPTNIDWYTYKVLAIHLGERRSGGYKVNVQAIEEDRRGGAVVRAFEETPMPGSFVSQGTTSPWVLVKVDKSARNPTLSLMKRESKNGVFGNGGGFNNGGNRCNCGPSCGCNCGCGG